MTYHSILSSECCTWIPFFFIFSICFLRFPFHLFLFIHFFFGRGVGGASPVPFYIQKVFSYISKLIYSRYMMKAGNSSSLSDFI